MLNIILNDYTTNYDFISDFECYPKNFNLGVAEPKYNFVQVPYRNGSLDMTEALGTVKYKDRNITVPMRIVASDPLSQYSYISTLFSGKQVKLKLIDTNNPDNSDFWYYGRVTISGLGTSKTAWDFDLVMTAKPYRIRQMSVQRSTSGTFTISNSGIDTLPTVTANTAISGTWNGKAFSAASGTHILSNFPLVHGDNTIYISNSTSVTIAYDEKRL